MQDVGVRWGWALDALRYLLKGSVIMDRTRVPTLAEVATAKAAWDTAKDQNAPKTERARAEGLYQQLRGRFLRELI
jgi:hypothetical protein